MNHRPTRPLARLPLAALVLSACVPAGTPPASASPASPTPLETRAPGPTASVTPTRLPPIQVDPAALRGVNVQVWDAFSGPSDQAFTDQVALFNTTNAWGIVAYPTDYQDYTTLYDTVEAGLGSGTKPDLVVALPEQVLAWAAAGAVVDLNPYAGDQAWGLKSSEASDVPAVFWNQDLSNGRRLGAPAQRSAHFLFYNETWAHELSFDHAPETSDEFRQQACAANASFRKDKNPQNDGFGGWIVDTSWQTTLSWLQAFGGDVTLDGTYSFRQDANLAALQFIKKLYNDSCAWLSTEPTPYDAFARRSALFVSGDLAEVPLEAEAMARLKNGDEWTVIPFPGPQKAALVTYGPSYALLASTPEKQLAAWLFVRWMLAADNQSKWAAATGSFPLRSSAPAAPGLSPQWTAALGSLPLAQGTPELASWRKIRYVLEDGAQSIFLKNLPLEQIPGVLADMDATAEELNAAP